MRRSLCDNPPVRCRCRRLVAVVTFRWLFIIHQKTLSNPRLTLRKRLLEPAAKGYHRVATLRPWKRTAGYEAKRE
jgi:hypothetical protein